MKQISDTEGSSDHKSLTSGKIIIAVAVGSVVASIVGWGSIFRGVSDDPRGPRLYQPYEKQLPLVLPGGWSPDGYSPNCLAPSNRSDAELCAQWAAVSAAEEANRLNRLSIRSGTLQAFFLVMSLFLSAIAAFAASRAAKAAEDGVKEAKKTAHKQLRAYIGIEPHPDLPSFQITEEKHVRCRFLVKNYGQTPAMKTSINLTMKILTPRDDGIEEKKIYENDDPFIISLMPGQSRDLSIISDDSMDGLDLILALKWAKVLISGTLSYNDIYGEDQALHFSFEARNSANLSKEALSLSRDGNYTT